MGVSVQVRSEEHHVEQRSADKGLKPRHRPDREFGAQRRADGITDSGRTGHGGERKAGQRRSEVGAEQPPNRESDGKAVQHDGGRQLAARLQGEAVAERGTVDECMEAQPHESQHECCNVSAFRRSVEQVFGDRGTHEPGDDEHDRRRPSMDDRFGKDAQDHQSADRDKYETVEDRERGAASGESVCQRPGDESGDAGQEQGQEGRLSSVEAMIFK